MSSYPEMIYYAGYGANRDPRMVQEIVGGRPKQVGNVAILGARLYVQRFEQIPEPHKSVIAEAWGDDAADLESYIIQEARNFQVDATLYELTPMERQLMANWERWFDPMEVTVIDDHQRLLHATTEGLAPGQDVSELEVVNGARYANYLMANPDKMYQIARNARQKFYKPA